MVIETICDRCGMSYDWHGVTIGDLVYCCTGCASGGPCICNRTTVVAGPTTTVVTDTSTDTVIVEE